MTMTSESAWVDIAKWSERWDILESLPGGGQGEAYRARRISDGQIGFLKTIKSKKDSERRARFFREASAYDTFRVSGIPYLIESNSHRHNDSGFDPYIATTFVEGPTLRKWREAAEDISLETAVQTTKTLLRILENCHSAGCVHRDVKPDNLILENGDPSRPFLLDFGLNYHDLPTIDFQTEDWQEVGNRFLRLPELSAGSVLKQDPRSDLSFAAGILFYLITGEHPDVLQDAEGRLPHQRSRAFAKLQAAAGGHFRLLAAVFDSTFAPMIADRFSNASVMLDSLEEVMTESGRGQSADDDLAAILQVVNTASQRRRVATNARLQDALRQVQKVFNAVEQTLGGAFTIGQTGFGVDGQVGKNTLFWTQPGSSERLLSTTYDVRETGEELVFRLSGETVFRTSISAPDYGEEFRAAIRTWVLARLRATVGDPDALPPEADYFAEVRPFPRIGDAAMQATQTEQKILAFVYDPSQPERGRLEHGLRYFLQNRRTRDSMNATFVTALVPLSQITACSDVLNNLSMEQSRWIVFDHELHPIEQAVIYANPQEGERIMTGLAQRYS
jgi:eukaryotic-like serine/threonine-protein kinase